MKVLITGGTNGMGKGVAKVLAERDNRVHEIIILCRSRERGEATVSELEATTQNSNISVVLCDLRRLSDVKSAIEEIHKEHDFLDGVFVNAGLGYAPRREETDDGMDPHFQVNYLAQFVLILNLLDLLERSERGGRVIFNVTKGGKIFWDDMQLKRAWSYEKGIAQAMVAKRMLSVRLNDLRSRSGNATESYIGFQIPKTVWSNQINIIPFYMKSIARVMKSFGRFISIEECGEIIAPLFTEGKEESLEKSGKLLTWRKGAFVEIEEDDFVFDSELQNRLWKSSLDLSHDDATSQIAEKL